MGQVVTELVVDADTSGADQFTQAMDRSAGSAQGATQSAKDTALAIAGVGAGALAAIATVSGLIGYVVDANKALADMQTVANQVGLSLRDFQAIQFGGQIAGLDPSQINNGLEKSAQLLNDASRNANSLSKELDANGISIKNSNGQLISENQLLGIAANLISNAKNPGDQLAIAQMLGFTRQWIPLLEQGSGVMNGLAAEAQKAGAIIDDDTINRATDFDTEWRKSSVEFSIYMKAAMAELLPVVDDLIERAAKFMKTFDRKAVNDALDGGLKTLNDPTGSGNILPQSGALHIDADALVQASKDFQSSPIFSTDTWLAFGKALGQGFQFMSVQQASEKIPGYASSQVTEQTYPTPGQYDAAFDKRDDDEEDARDAIRARSKVASNDVVNDAVDKAINTLRRHTEQQIADTQAVGLGDGALAAFRAQAQETAAVQANHGKETEEQAAAFKALETGARAAADALARAKVASDIQFSGGTAFLSANDVAIATQLKGIYGNDIPAALGSTYAASIRVNDAFKEIGTALDSNITSGLTDIVTGTKSVSAGFTDMGNAIVKALDQAIIKLLIVQPLMQSLQSGLSGLGIGGLGGGGAAAQATSASTLANNTGGAFFGPGFASGTDSAPGGWAMVGENGPELMRVPTGAQILPNGKMPSNDNGSSNVTVNLIEDSSRAGQVQQSQNSSGGTDITAFVDSITAKNAANPGSATSQVLNQRGRLASR